MKRCTFCGKLGHVAYNCPIRPATIQRHIAEIRIATTFRKPFDVVKVKTRKITRPDGTTIERDRPPRPPRKPRAPEFSWWRDYQWL